MATLLRVGRLWDGTGAATVADAELRLDGGKVVAVGAHGTLEQRFDQVVERRDATATPGFIDVHTHVCYPLDSEFQSDARGPGKLALLAAGFRPAPL